MKLINGIYLKISSIINVVYINLVGSNKKQFIGLFVIDNPSREFDGFRRIKREFEKENYRILVSSKLDVIDYLKILKPNFVICPKPGRPFSDIKSKFKKNITFYCLPCEHGFGISEKVLNHFGEEKNSSLYIGNDIKISPKEDWQAIFLPSFIHKEILEKTNNYPSKQLIVTGNLNSDNWLKNYSQIINTNSIISKPLQSKKVGISTTFKNFLFGIAYKSPLLGIYDHSFKKENNWRLDFLRYEFEYLRLLFILIKSMPDINFVIRPHPHESKYIWRILCKKIKNLELSREISLKKWLNDKSICINSFSTTSIDTAMQGIPSLSLDNLISKKTYERLPKNKIPFISEFSLRPNTLSEAEEVIRKKIISYDEIDQVNFIECCKKFKKVFFLDRREKASVLIKNFIVNNSNTTKKANHNKTFLFNLRLLFINVKATIRYLRSNRKDSLLKPHIALYSNFKN